MKTVTFPLGSRRFSAYFSLRSETCVVFVHGFASSKESGKAVMLSGICQGLDRSFFAMDFSGCGESEGDIRETTLTQRIQELQGGLAYLNTQGIKQFVLVGSSFGALVALYLADREDILCACFIACPVFWEKVLAQPGEGLMIDNIFLSPAFAHDMKEHFPLAQGSVVKRALVLHGSEDQVVPVKNGQSLFESLAKPKKLHIVQGGDHRISQLDHRAECMKEIVSWIKKWG